MLDPYSGKEQRKFYFRSFLWALYAIPWAIVGIAFCATGFLIIIGLPLIWIGIKPLGKLHKKRVQSILDWQNSKIVPVFDDYENNQKPWNQ